MATQITAPTSSTALPSSADTRCRSKDCTHDRVRGRLFCQTHTDLFASIADELPMDFKRGKPKHLVPHGRD